MAKNQHVFIVGTGFAGLGMAIRLSGAGFDDYTIVEQADRIGGTWRDNTYPGAACDVESHLYSYSFAPYADWSRTFAPQGEILKYMEDCVDRFDLRDRIRFNCGVERAVFDERTGLWTVTLSDGSTMDVRAIVAGCGGLSRPRDPDIPGLASFEGDMFHSARWDHSVPLTNQRVGVIGTGASAIQIVPNIAPEVKHLSVFQRTPPWIAPKDDRAYTDREKRRFRRYPALQKLTRLSLYLQHEVLALGFVVHPRWMKLPELYARRYLQRAIPDPVLRAKVTPNYVIGCKRILLSNDYYPALQRDNVDLITERIERIEPNGIRTRDGVLHGLDAIVLATGFYAAESVAPFDVRGRGNESLAEVWAKAGPEAYLGTTVSGFPNLFIIVGPNTGLGHSSMIYMIESQINYILGALDVMRDRGLRFVDVRADAQDGYNRSLHARLGNTVWATGCNSWYQTSTGKNTTLWPGFTFEFRRRTRHFDPAVYELAPDLDKAQVGAFASGAPVAV